MKLNLICLLIALGLTAGSAQAQSQNEFDREDFDQPTLTQKPAATLLPPPEGMERVVGVPRILGYGFKAKSGGQVLTIACVGEGTPANCGRLRHIIATPDGKDTFYFGPTYTIANGEPTDAQLKSFAKRLNQMYKNSRGGFRVDRLLTLVAFVGAFFTAPPLCYVLFFGSLTYYYTGFWKSKTWSNKVMSVISAGDPHWAKMRDPHFDSYMNLIEPNSANRFHNYWKASERTLNHELP